MMLIRNESQQSVENFVSNQDALRPTYSVMRNESLQRVFTIFMEILI